jgi:hypothetical protein
MAYNRYPKYYKNKSGFHSSEEYPYYKSGKRYKNPYSKSGHYYFENSESEVQGYSNFNSYKSSGNYKPKKYRDFKGKKYYNEESSKTSVAENSKFKKSFDTFSQKEIESNQELFEMKRKNWETENPYQDLQLEVKSNSKKRKESFDYPCHESFRKQNSTISNASNSSTRSKVAQQTLSYDQREQMHNFDPSEGKFESESELTESNLNDLSYFSTSIEGDYSNYASESYQNDDSALRASKFHNPSIFCLRNWSAWRLKIRKTHNPFAQHQKQKSEIVEKEGSIKTIILSKQVGVRGQEVNVDFLQDLQEADNWTSIESPVQLDTGYDWQKENLSQIEGIDTSGTENSSVLLDAFLPIRNEELINDFVQLNNMQSKLKHNSNSNFSDYLSKLSFLVELTWIFRPTIERKYICSWIWNWSGKGRPQISKGSRPAYGRISLAVQTQWKSPHQKRFWKRTRFRP